MKKIARAIKHLEGAVAARKGPPAIMQFEYYNGVTDGLKQALNACREIAAPKHRPDDEVSIVRYGFGPSAFHHTFATFAGNIKTVVD